MGQPRVFGERYELGELIGYGGMAEVHKGRDVRLGRDVAIKVLRSDLARDPSFQTRFRREAQAAARLNHPSIVAVYDTGEDIGPNGAVPYIVMEFIEGRTLRDVLRSEGSLQATRAMEIVAEICSALDYSHRAGIVHRDIKPANVMITRTGSVKVMDFGIARAVADDAATVTQTAAVIGTAQYLSPEQARGESVDARSDVYSTGCLLYELVTGRPPFVGDSPVAVAYQHVREVPPLPSTLNPQIPRALDSVTMKALAKNPQNRYQSAGEMGADLSRILADQPVRAETALTDEERTQFIARPGAVAAAGVGGIGFDGDDQHDNRTSRRGAIVWALIVAALLVVIVGVAYLVLRNSDKAPEQATVPSLVGKTVDQANNALRTAGFAAVPNPAVNNGQCGDGGTVVVPEGNVCTQSVPNGTRKDVDSPITFTIYKAGTVNVPPVIGLQFNVAQPQLAQLGFNVVPQEVHNSQQAGTVVAQDPKANTAAGKGATVTLQVSDGKLQIPADLVGKPLQDALAALNNNGFTSGITTTEQDVTDPSKVGIVLSVQPTPGVYVDPGTDIAIVVGKLAAPTTPPASCTTPGSTPTGTPSPGSTPLPPCTSGSPTGTGSPSPTGGGGGGGGGNG